ncbi:putative PAS domain, phytochrome, GAF domain, histidine kinase/HSP90-like ATPase [Helianthus annuus]|nr:putative PAS domain, phytochrome, GAF domain, histidine kinase/HSP90-like ATPase [Helianthus annuus]KAJ0684243.1 putative PAS domain, phytochrome, GAF domain, histidine kinase/HSP90-like ATPase [Helianthus annuus]KAJ0688194.1 putative PAS domain, phytochrome, GAF domain, histidine kinase/HSP90-like ATPase [Helianthus annuus]
MSSKSTSRTHCSKSSSSRLKREARVISQTPADAKLHVDFEESERQFDYSTSIDVNASTSTSNVPSSTVSAYLQKVQRGGQIQPFGCLIAIDDQTLSVLAYSENALEMLDLAPHAVPSIEQQEVLTFGTDVRTLFRSSSASALQKAANFHEVNLLNPILVHCRTSGKPFYAILHRDDVGLIIDLEPVNPAEVPVTAAGALKSYKLASKAISRLQSLQSGNISRLCDVLVKEVSELTGYDRVMVYKFHEDEHGEVIAECCRKPDLEPYLGLHYPATDIPQASRSLFMKNKIRVICDCLAQPVKVIQTESLSQPLNLSGSALRAPHGCHSQYMANMGSIASLVMSVTINDGDEDYYDNDNDDGNESQSGINLQETQKGKRLWGLVVCHHSSARFVSFPLRYACEFLIQVFGVQINKEVELTSQQREKHILKTQTVLCDMLLRDAPTGIMTQTPNVMDLVTCDGAALYYKNKFWLLGITPTESQVKDIANWLREEHIGSTGLSTDSLMDAGYPNALILGKAVCGMAAVKITSKDFLFWFRSHAAKEVKWGGAKNDPDDKDDGRKMHPRSSFKAFLEVVKNRSLPWEDVEMDAIHSLRLILRGSLEDDDEAGGDDVAGDDDESNDKKIVRVPDVDMRIQRVDELRVVANEMVRLIETASVPVFAVDGNGNISGWNDKIAEITGLPLDQAVGVSLLNLVVDDSVDEVKAMISSALRGIEEKNVEINFKCFGSQENDHITLVTNACCSRDLKQTIVGVCFVGQDLTAQKMMTEKYTKTKDDFASFVRSPCTLIPPIFMMDEYGKCLEWNDAMVKLTGFPREEANNKMLLGEVFTDGNFGCRVKSDMLTRLRILLNEVISGLDADKLMFGFFDQNSKYVEGLLSANKRVNGDGKITGVLCFIHVTSPELQHAMLVQRMSEQAALNSLTKVSYLKHELKNGLNGIKFIDDLMESELSGEQQRILRNSGLCRDQLAQIVDDSDIESIEQCYTEVKCVEFKLGECLDVVLNQVKSLSRERKVEVVFDASEQVSSLSVYGDNLRVQQVLSDFLSNALFFTQDFEGSSVSFRVTHKMERIGAKIQVAHLEFRITHPSPGMPEKLIQDMFHSNRSVSREGLGLYISQRLVKIMNGSVQYLREAERASFIVLIEFPVSPLLTSDNKRSKRI